MKRGIVANPLSMESDLIVRDVLTPGYNHKWAEPEWVDRSRGQTEKRTKAHPAKPTKFVSGTICSGLMWRYVFVTVCLSAALYIQRDVRRKSDNTTFDLKWQQNITLWNTWIYLTSTKTLELKPLDIKPTYDSVSVAHQITHTPTCLDSLMLQGSSLTFDPAVKAVMARHRSCWRICGSIRVHFWENRTDKWLHE